jgi:hypothetical protein
VVLLKPSWQCKQQYLHHLTTGFFVCKLKKIQNGVKESGKEDSEGENEEEEGLEEQEGLMNGVRGKAKAPAEPPTLKVGQGTAHMRGLGVESKTQACLLL